jgi:hypothetical protein
MSALRRILVSYNARIAGRGNGIGFLVRCIPAGNMEIGNIFSDYSIGFQQSLRITLFFIKIPRYLSRSAQYETCSFHKRPPEKLFGKNIG